MLKGCGLAVKNFGENMSKTFLLYTFSPAVFINIVKRTIIVHRINTALSFLSAFFSQAFSRYCPPYVSTFSTNPINTTNLIKDYL